jgi:hypothetical protein
VANERSKNAADDRKGHDRINPAWFDRRALAANRSASGVTAGHNRVTAGHNQSDAYGRPQPTYGRP